MLDEAYHKDEKQKFKIDTYTYSIFNQKLPQTSLIQKKLKYIIPVYQRPYSWNDVQIEHFINDIFFSFWGIDKDSESESIFIGTMQLSGKIKENKNDYYQEVIDGQQRITTIILFLKLLSKKYPELMPSDFEWINTIDTKVNRGQQSKDLKEVLFKNNFTDLLNKYAENYNLIEKYFGLNILSNEDNEQIKFPAEKFINYILTNLYFVVIETNADLSKTLKIFNAINTTGLDLNNTDVFKIKLYEYLSINADGKDIFEDIDKLYEKIDSNNSNFGKKIINMNSILSIYKSFLISKYGLGITFWKMSTGKFFEQLFDNLLNIKKYHGFLILKEEKNILKIQDIDKIIDVRYEWEKQYYGKNGKFDNFNTMLSLRLFWWSRYSSNWNLAFLYFLKDSASKEKYNVLLQELSRLYISYTLLHKKRIDKIEVFTKGIFQDLLKYDENIDEIILKIKQKYILIKEDVIKKLSSDIFDNRKVKNILVRMSASIEENKSGKPIKKIEELIFNTKIDVEHIKPINDKDFKDEKIKEEWNEKLNKIGNLIILEYSINRSIGNNYFSERIKAYEKSEFCIVKNFPENFPSWELDDVDQRHEYEVDKIKKFLYSWDG